MLLQKCFMPVTFHSKLTLRRYFQDKHCETNSQEAQNWWQIYNTKLEPLTRSTCQNKV